MKFSAGQINLSRNNFVGKALSFRVRFNCPYCNSLHVSKQINLHGEIVEYRCDNCFNTIWSVKHQILVETWKMMQEEHWKKLGEKASQKVLCSLQSNNLIPEFFFFSLNSKGVYSSDVHQLYESIGFKIEEGRHVLKLPLEVPEIKVPEFDKNKENIRQHIRKLKNCTPEELEEITLNEFREHLRKKGKVYRIEGYELLNVRPKLFLVYKHGIWFEISANSPSEVISEMKQREVQVVKIEKNVKKSLTDLMHYYPQKLDGVVRFGQDYVFEKNDEIISTSKHSFRAYAIALPMALIEKSFGNEVDLNLVALFIFHDFVDAVYPEHRKNLKDYVVKEREYKKCIEMFENLPKPMKNELVHAYELFEGIKPPRTEAEKRAIEICRAADTLDALRDLKKVEYPEDARDSDIIKGVLELKNMNTISVQVALDVFRWIYENLINGRVLKAAKEVEEIVQIKGEISNFEIEEIVEKYKANLRSLRLLLQAKGYVYKNQSHSFIRSVS